MKREQAKAEVQSADGDEMGRYATVGREGSADTRLWDGEAKDNKSSNHAASARAEAGTAGRSGAESEPERTLREIPSQIGQAVGACDEASTPPRAVALSSPRRANSCQQNLKRCEAGPRPAFLA